MKFLLCTLLACIAVPLSAQSAAPPDAAEQQELLRQIRASAMRFQGHLPDFLCTKLTQRFEDHSGTGHSFKLRDTLEESVVFSSNGQTAIKLVKLNDKLTNRPRFGLRGIGGVIEDALLWRPAGT